MRVLSALILFVVALSALTSVSIASDRPTFNMPEGKVIEISIKGNVSEATYRGRDHHGHKFTTDGGPTFWLGDNHDFVRYQSENGTVFRYENVATGGLMVGGPGETWSVNYELAGTWRTGKCTATDVNPRGYYTIDCADKRVDKNFGLTREIVVHSKTGMWISRSRVDDYNGTKSAWKLTSDGIRVATASR